jgi:hypothetical protein
MVFYFILYFENDLFLKSSSILIPKFPCGFLGKAKQFQT